LRTYKVPELVLLVLERVDVYAFLVEERRAHLELREDRGDEGGLGGGGVAADGKARRCSLSLPAWACWTRRSRGRRGGRRRE
jgi:hypothetical protein